MDWILLVLAGWTEMISWAVCLHSGWTEAA